MKKIENWEDIVRDVENRVTLLFDAGVEQRIEIALFFFFLKEYGFDINKENHDPTV